MASNSERSSLADLDVDAYGGEQHIYSHSHSHSTSSSLTTASAAFPLPPTSRNISSASRQREWKHSSTTSQDIPTFSEFRARAPSIPPSSPGFVAHSHRPASTSIAERASPRVVSPVSRPHSLQDSPAQPVAGKRLVSLPSPPVEENFEDRHPFEHSTLQHQRTDSRDSSAYFASSAYGDSRPTSVPAHSSYAHEQTTSHAPRFSVSSVDFLSSNTPAHRLSPVSSMNGTSKPPSMKLELEGVQRTLTDESLSSLDSPNTSRPKSPGGRLGNLFGWKKPNNDSPSTTFSDHSLSPMPSPYIQRSNSMDAVMNGARLTPPGHEVQRANMQHRSDYFDNDETPLLLGTPETNAHVKELEKELTQVSTELAESIRREMELEDEIDRIKADLPSGSTSDATRRSSDYFSDSGASSTRFPSSDVDSKLEQMEQKVRRAEQEKAQIKVEMASRLQTELSRRRDLEIMVHKLEEQFQAKMDEDDERGDAEERVEELESTLEDTRRLLKQERQAKASFEDLYSATKGELERHIHQHDNLKDEVVPQLKARIDGLESEAADNQALVYENSRMQQELAALKAKMHGRFGSIVEEEDSSSSGRPSLSRSGSLARNVSRRGGSLSRSMTVAERADGTRQRSGSGTGVLTVEGVKEIEDQRDALHKALKLLIIRSEKQQRDHERAIKKLTTAKRLIEISSPGRSAYHKEVSFLKEEVATLRKRTEDALEQKWQYEKGLSGIKMDLDRAELETRGLRIILQEHDILGSSQRTLLSNGKEDGDAADEQLQQSIFTAETERDQARKVAAEYRQRAQAVEGSSSTELANCARRMDELADQLEKQVQSNIELRSRLAEAVARGEQEQRESNGKIGEMQKRLANMEDSVLAAQQHSEETLGTHEAEVRKLEEASSPALHRLRNSMNPITNNKLAPTSPLMVKSPRLGSKKLSENSLLEMSKTQMLERKVRELEALLREAEEDMQDVVQKVNKSQLEVAELQTERDAAFSQMRKLQNLIVQEREKAETLMR